MDFGTFHLYNRLVRRGLTKPLTCSCGEVYTLRQTEDSEPALQCFACQSVIQPGLNMYNNILAVVREHFE